MIISEQDGKHEQGSSGLSLRGDLSALYLEQILRLTLWMDHLIGQKCQNTCQGMKDLKKFAIVKRSIVSYLF